ncbi:MAG TPA: hypothetical protein VH817_13375 [Thermoleophilaceae bacterium]|jgi:hypothetical protein
MTPQSRKIKSTLALTLALGAIAPAAALAQPLPADPPGWPANTPTIELVQSSPRAGFDWGDAAIGAAAGLGLSMVAVGGSVVLVRRHGRHADGPTSAAS